VGAAQGGDIVNNTPTETLGDQRPVFPPPSAPLDVARKLYVPHRFGGNGLRTLIAWRGGWMRWDTTHWSELDNAHLRSEIYETLGEVDYQHPIREKGVVVDYEIRPWSPDKHKVANVIEAMAAVGHLSTDVDPPSWIGLHSAAKMTAAQMIACRNGLLDLSTRTLADHTPALFNVVSVPFDYRPDVPEPSAWLEFLESLWPDDPDSIALLQEYVGYVLSGRTDMQKMLLLIGPTRSGKGTIARMLAALIGRGHVAGPTLASLGTNFGLSPLLGKPLAIISDARLGDTPAHTVVERLLSITGEDLLTVDRKFKEPWSGKLPTRFVILSNELPKFKDSSGAIANRLLILQMTRSFLHREDRTLDERLSAELPGILAWALDGLDRLVANGRFTVPASSRDAADLMADLASPVSAFVRDCCERKPDATVAADRLYDAWKQWCEDNGHHPGAKATFGRNLRAVVPELKVSQPREGNLRVRTYVCIGLLPVPPVPGDETAGQSATGVDGHPVPPADRLVPPDHPEQAGTGYPVPNNGLNTQVSDGGTGGTGQSAFKAQHSPDGAVRNGFCKGCGTYYSTHGAHRADCTVGAS
jgi:putative DNA primase/helicase